LSRGVAFFAFPGVVLFLDYQVFGTNETTNLIAVYHPTLSMSFLETIFSQALTDGVKEEKSNGPSPDFVPSPMTATKSPFDPYSRSLNSRTRPGSVRRSFPVQYAASVSVIEDSLQSGERLGQGYRVITSNGPTSFVIQKHNGGRHFSVKVGLRRSCSCPECEVNEAGSKGGILDSTAVLNVKVRNDPPRKICGAMLFVLMKVLRVPKESPLLFKENWSEKEIENVIKGQALTRGEILRQNFRQPLTAANLEPGRNFLYDDEYDEQYGYDQPTLVDQHVLGGLYMLDER